MKEIVSRYAPSPSGLLHIGNIATSLLTWLDCRKAGGKLILRMEDIDRDRCKSEYAFKIADDLQWLGIPYDKGWDENSPEFAQSSRTELYDEAFKLLFDKGLVYPCYCSRCQRLAASAPHPGEVSVDYGCKCRSLTDKERQTLEQSGRRPSWKVSVPNREISFTDGHYGKISENLAVSGDFIIRRSDGIYAYQLAVSVDDMEMGINRVVRGHDLLGSTAKQIWLINELGGTAPEYCHAPLLVTEDSRKMSKRYGDLSTEVLRNKYSPEELTGKIAFLLGLADSSAPISPCELLENFSWDKISKNDIEFKSSEW
ncbi:MAG: glutamate--tRNA ligase family protein [Bacillota bacterium]|nr:glutamate--tRNA ligase family protein [Bacillota bacterium]